jgi:hypothetical protein
MFTKIGTVVKVRSLIFVSALTSSRAYFPSLPSNAASCSMVKQGVKIVGSQINFSNEKSALQMVAAYRLVLENPNCFSNKEFRGMKIAARDLIKSCKDSKSGLSALLGEKVWDSFCKGFLTLEKYTK